ncbi:MAG: response regulator [Candidatus Competibacteraceae bacterium]
MALILVVEDSPTQTYSLKKLLTNYGHDVITAVDGEEGVDLARIMQPDLILMDILLPKVNGFQATRVLTRDANTSHIPIVVISNKTMETDVIWGKRQGAKRYFTKPIDEKELIKAVNELLLVPRRSGGV